MSSLANVFGAIGAVAFAVIAVAAVLALVVLDTYIVLAGVTAVLAFPLFAAPISGTAVALVIIYILIRALVSAVSSSS